MLPLDTGPSQQLSAALRHASTVLWGGCAGHRRRLSCHCHEPDDFVYIQQCSIKARLVHDTAFLYNTSCSSSQEEITGVLFCHLFAIKYNLTLDARNVPKIKTAYHLPYSFFIPTSSLHLFLFYPPLYFISITIPSFHVFISCRKPSASLELTQWHVELIQLALLGICWRPGGRYCWMGQSEPCVVHCLERTLYCFIHSDTRQPSTPLSLTNDFFCFNSVSLISPPGDSNCFKIAVSKHPLTKLAGFCIYRNF